MRDIDPEFEAIWQQWLVVNKPAILPRTPQQLLAELRGAAEFFWQARGECCEPNGGDVAA